MSTWLASHPINRHRDPRFAGALDENERNFGFRSEWEVFGEPYFPSPGFVFGGSKPLFGDVQFHPEWPGHLNFATVLVGDCQGEVDGVLTVCDLPNV